MTFDRNYGWDEDFFSSDDYKSVCLASSFAFSIILLSISDLYFFVWDFMIYESCAGELMLETNWGHTFV